MTLGQRFVVLAISVVYRGCAIPVAWVILPAGAKHAWRREWLRLVRRLRPAILPVWTVIVLADRGVVCAVAVSTDRAPGLASVLAHQYGRQKAFGQQGRPAGGRWRASRAAAWEALAWHGPGFLRATKCPAPCWRAGKTATKPWLLLTVGTGGQ